MASPFPRLGASNTVTSTFGDKNSTCTPRCNHTNYWPAKPGDYIFDYRDLASETNRKRWIDFITTQLVVKPYRPADMADFQCLCDSRVLFKARTRSGPHTADEHFEFCRLLQTNGLKFRVMNGGEPRPFIVEHCDEVSPDSVKRLL